VETSVMKNQGLRLLLHHGAEKLMWQEARNKKSIFESRRHGKKAEHYFEIPKSFHRKSNDISRRPC
jgi:hypothetical protein